MRKYIYIAFIMNAIASQTTSVTIVYSTVYSGVDQRKHQNSASLAFVTGEFPTHRASNATNDDVSMSLVPNHNKTQQGADCVHISGYTVL